MLIGLRLIELNREL